MKKWLILVVLLTIALLLSTASGLAAAPQPDRGQGHALDRILVKFQPAVSEGAKAAVHSRHGGKVVDIIPGIDVQVISVPENKVAEKVRAYQGEASVEFAEPDYIVKAIPPAPLYTPNDALYQSLGQWGIDKIQAPLAWDVTKGSSTVVIAILDTGIDQDHEDINPKIGGKIVKNKNFTSSRTVDDKYGHGTHVAGIAAAITDNATGVAGVGFNSRLMNAKVLGDSGSGFWSWVAKGITWAADNGAKVISMSLGGSIGSYTLEKAVNYAWGKGAILLAAAGNESTSAPSYPAYYANVIAVAATDQNDVKADFSNYGGWVDIAAPGVDILSTFPNHRNYFSQYYDPNLLNYVYWGGTSMATPHVAGVVALVFAAHLGWTNAQVRDRILAPTSVDATTGFTTLIGRVNAYKAVSSP